MDIEKIKNLQYKDLRRISENPERIIEFIDNELSKNTIIYIKRETPIACGCIFFRIDKIFRLENHHGGLLSSKVELFSCFPCINSEQEHAGTTWLAALITFYSYSTYSYSTNLSILI